MSKIKDWKQITTRVLHETDYFGVVQDVKDQRLKANHNLARTRCAYTSSGSRCQRSKIESKSQQGQQTIDYFVQWFKMSKIKDWKQITTMGRKFRRSDLVVQDVKDQRLKANHNFSLSTISFGRVVQDVKDQRLKANHNILRVDVAVS